MLCKLYNKRVCRYQNQTEHADKGVTYQQFCSNCLASTGKKYEHPKQQCLRLKMKKGRLKYTEGLIVLAIVPTTLI